MNRRLRNRNRVRFPEPLEQRLALSGPADVVGFDLEWPALGILSAEPADGSVFTSIPGRLSVQFDRPLDPFSVFLNDLRLERVDAEGNLVWSTEREGMNLESLLDDSDTRLFTTLPADPLSTPGTYRLVLSEMSFVMGLDGSILEAFGEPRIVSTFSVAPRGASLDDAEDLGMLRSGVELAVNGQLDFHADRHDVRLYRFEVTNEAAVWRVGVAVDAERLGSPLDSVLSLFDEQGRLLMTREIGLRDAPKDPYLFAGLTAGTYYLGVSGVGNVPGQPGGYDPALGLPELVDVERTGGMFRLSLVADPVTAATPLISFRLRRGDPFDSAPTGFDLQFAALVTPAPRPDGNEPVGVRLVDGNGKNWPVVGAGFDVNQAKLSFAIINRLPPGKYTVRINNTYGLADLAGRAPVSTGELPGVLASFEVAGNRPANQDAANVGIAFVQELRRGIARSVALQPGEQYAFRLVATRADLLQLGLTYSGGAGTLDVTTNSGQPVRFELGARIKATNTNRLVSVDRGPLIIRIRATGDAPFTLGWKLTTTQSDNERLLLNGNGQGPALQLRLITPTLSAGIGAAPGSNLPAVEVGENSTGAFGGTGGSAGLDSQSPISTPGLIGLPMVVAPIVLPTGPGDRGVGLDAGLVDPTIGGDADRGSARSTPISPSLGLVLALPTGPLGRPSGEASGTGPVVRSAAPTAESVMMIARSAGDALFGSPGDTEQGASGPPLDSGGGGRRVAAVAGRDQATSVVADADAVELKAETAPLAESADPRADWATGWMGELLARLAPTPEPPAEEFTEPTTGEDAAALDPSELAERSRRGGRKESSRLDADLGSPAAAVAAAALVAEAHRRLQRWLGRRRGVGLVGGGMRASVVVRRMSITRV